MHAYMSSRMNSKRVVARFLLGWTTYIKVDDKNNNDNASLWEKANQTTHL